MSITETGHAKNAANFESLVSFITGYGPAYNPTKAAIKLPELNTLLASARSSLAGVYNALTPYQNAVNASEITFHPLSKLVTRIVNALDSTDASKQVVSNAKTLARKIQGQRVKIKDDPSAPGEKILTISSSQTSFDSRIEFFQQTHYTGF